MARRRRVLGALGVVGVGGMAAGLLVRGGGTDAGDTGTSGPATPATSVVSVEQRDLVRSDTYDGTLGYGEARTHAGERAGIVTTVAEVGATVEPGGSLFSVDFEPTVLLAGAVPAYRALDPSAADGPDVAQLEQGLVDLGFGDGVTVDESFTSATAAAVEDWEASLGRAEPDGTVELGDVVFSASSLRVAGVAADVGSRVDAGTDILDATATTRVVTLDLDASEGSELEAGTVVDLTLPDGTETTGTVAAVGGESSTASSSSSSSAAAGDAGTGAATATGGSADDGEDTVPVVVTLDDPAAAAGFDSGGVDVAIERSRVEDALVVPVTALVALAEGGYAVQVADDARASGYRLVGVTVDTYADGYAAVTGDGVEAGLDVVVPA